MDLAPHRPVAPPAVAGVVLLLGAVAAALLTSGAVGHTAALLLATAGTATGIASATRRAGDHAAVERLLTAVTDLHAAGDERTAADSVAALVHTLLTADGVVVLLAEPPGSGRWVERGRRGSAAPDDRLLVVPPCAPGATPSGPALAAATGRAVVARDTRATPVLDAAVVAAHRMGSAAFLPLPGEGGHLGVVLAWWTAPGRVLDAESERVAEVVSRTAGQVLERVRAVERLHHAATTDALTGLANRRTLLESLDRLRPGDAVLFLDLDHFKALNDSRGHAAGDAVLVAFAEVVRSAVREGDCAARYGGEEFAVVLRTDGTAGAAHVVERRVRTRWAAAGLGVTFSAGLALHVAGDAPSTTLARADAALYAAKAGGRDRLVVESAAGAVAAPAPAVPGPRPDAAPAVPLRPAP